MATQTDPTPALITTASLYAIGGALVPPVAAPGFGGGTWGAGANGAFYVPICLPFTYNVVRVYTCNGGTASGNFDFGFYDANFTRLSHTGSVAQAGTNVNQYVALSQGLTAGVPYYLALAFDNGVGTNLRATVVSTIYLRPAGLLTQAAAFPLPATATPAVFSGNNFPLFGITRTASGF